MVALPPALIDRFEDEHLLWGKRTRDLAWMAGWRFEAGRKFDRLVDGCFVLALFSVLLSNPLNPLYLLSCLSVGVNAATMTYAGLCAATIRRQLNRRAAEQLLRDLNGIKG